MRSKEGVARPVFAAKAGDFNLLSLTGFACPRSPVKPGLSCISRVHGILQRIARLEHRNRRGSDRQTFACPRVARGTRLPVPGAERAEVEYPCLFAIRQGLADGLDHAVDCILCGGGVFLDTTDQPLFRLGSLRFFGGLPDRGPGPCRLRV